MSKFICLCGITFKKQRDADLHVNLYSDIAKVQGFNRHKIFKQHWQPRLSSWFFDYPWRRLFRFVGGYIIYIVIVNHFDIHWNWWESVLIGLGMGFYIE
jgi:hypothetical protein